MRQIKFRAWDRDKTEMLVPSEVAAVQPLMTWGGSCYRNGVLQNYEMMQFTGLLDKNGKEIYEGDIVEDVSDSDLTFEVKWNKEQCGYWMPEDFSQEAHYPISHVQLEIVGNIYENLELLKK